MMNNIVVRILLIVSLFTPFDTLAQSGIKGRVTTTSNTALPYATIVVHQSTMGAIANENGDYELALSPGQYEVDFQFLGFAKVRKKIIISNTWQTINVQLAEQVIHLESAHVGRQSEDPAYTVMRRAIAKARFHEMQIKHYKAQAYTRTTGTFTSIPLLARQRLKKEGIVVDQAFLNESVTEIQFERPNKFQQRVISTRNSLDNTIPTPNEYVLASFYSPSIQGTTSPLSPKAFSVYKFEYEGFFEDQGFVVNKIKVIPKSYGQGLVKGTLYIVEDSWAIHSFDFQTTSQGFTVGLKQTSAYQQNVWIPLTQNFQLKGKFLGFAGHMRYIVSLQYKQLDIDPAFREDIQLHDHKKSDSAPTSSSKKASLEELISQQQEFSTKNFKKLVENFEKQEKKARKSKGENTRIVRTDSLSVDSLAHTRDTTYWQTIRPIPLTITEQKSYSFLDSLQIIKDSIRVAKNNSNDSAYFHVSQLLTGGRYKLKNQQKITYRGPLRNIQYNTIDGIALDLSLQWQKIIRKETHFGFQSLGRYAIHRQKFQGTLSSYYTHKQASFYLNAGENTFQINENNPVNPLINSIATLLFEQNDLKVFDKKYISLHYKQSLFNESFTIKTSLEYSQRKALQNLKHPWKFFDWKSRTFSSNTPEVEEIGDGTTLIANSASIASVLLQYRPWQQFIVRNGKKYALSSQSPEFSVHYKSAFELGEFAPRYHFLEIGARTQWQITPQSNLKINLSSGTFFSTNNHVYLIDFKHFMSNSFFVQLRNTDDNFRLLPLYKFSTQKRFFQSHLAWSSKHFLLGQIPMIRYIGLKETLQHHYLKTPTSPHYQEFIYGIEGIFRVLKLEFITQFNSFHYTQAGIRIGTILTIGK